MSIISCLQAEELRVGVDYYTYYAPGTGSYVEFYYAVDTRRLVFVENEDGHWQGAVQVVTLFETADTVAQVDKYVLQTPLVEDAGAIPHRMLDLRRVLLPPGSYEVSMYFTDHHDTTQRRRLIFPLEVDHEAEQLSISDIMGVEAYEEAEAPHEDKFVKSGLRLYPYFSRFYPVTKSVLTFYAEVYHLASVSSDPVIITSSVRDPYENRVVANINRFRKETPEVVNVVVGKLDISRLPTGQYDLVLEVRSSENEVLTSRRWGFTREHDDLIWEDTSRIHQKTIRNTFVDTMAQEALTYYLKTLSPIADRRESKLLEHYLEHEHKETARRQFFYDFWQQRNPEDPGEAWQDYDAQVDKINKWYSTQQDYGFETDRGRIYLKYGSPNQMVRRTNEPGAKPYEIWHYYELEQRKQSDVRFVFYNPHLVHNDYELIHSEARGEVYNPRWQMRVYRSFRDHERGGYNLDRINLRRHHGKHADDLFEWQ